ncbi:hypothetical protein N7510_007004 [Penicillium lagena]|uniref:uncharacterized protein n=1 Tax=Penicillium lagena TaxID=94218 RepID=UPI0025412F20|nr:uncharacterized protein N7510_007004 [Penicillium lagena]KAJ5610285.1 hypothetical protein N7510_007004 [Penicillium lagena]
MRPSILLATLRFLGPFVSAHTESADSWITTIWDHFKQAVDCTGCQALLRGLKLVADFGETFMEDVLIGVCNTAGVEDADVCSGIIQNEGSAVHYTLLNLHIGSHTAITLCAGLIGLCQYPAVRPYNLSFPVPKQAKSRPEPSGQSSIKVVHFSDTHVDLSYEIGSNYDCSKPICCRAYIKEDAPGNTSNPCGPWGNLMCDPPHRLQESMMAAIAELNPAFSIYTGDVPAHDIWSVTKAEALRDFNATYGSMKRGLGIVFPALGNHDAAPLNLFPPNKIPSEYNPQWAYDALAADWLGLTGMASVHSAIHHGSYSAVYSENKLRVVSYNSIFYYKDNFFMYEEPMEYDPNGQFAWLISELQSAENANQRVWLIAHIPSGNADHFRDYSHYFDEIVQRYDSTIAALFFGHTHTDAFQIAYSNYSSRNWDTASTIGYIAPSMTPTSGSPSFRVYEIDPVTFGVMDFTQYIANISHPSYQITPKWELYYSAKKAYGSQLSPPVQDPSAEMTPAFWHNVTVAMEQDASVFQAFWARRTRGINVASCTGNCMTDKICALRGADAQYNCAVPTVGFSFRKRDVNERAFVAGDFRLECNHAGMGPLLAKIAHRAALEKEKEVEHTRENAA